nr:MAG TPA: hypothetical protein [Caudoviricetes sp.]
MFDEKLVNPVLQLFTIEIITHYRTFWNKSDYTTIEIIFQRRNNLSKRNFIAAQHLVFLRSLNDLCYCELVTGLIIHYLIKSVNRSFLIFVNKSGNIFNTHHQAPLESIKET